MAELLVLSEEEVRRLIALDELTDGLVAALTALSDGEASVPPRVAALGPDGLLGAMPGYLAGSGLAAKLVTVFPGSAELGLPTHEAIVAVFDESNGSPRAILGGTYLTAIRTGATTALAVSALADPEAVTLAIVGAGVQGASHLTALTHERHWREIRIASRSSASAKSLAKQHLSATAASSVQEAVEGADVVCCCTDAGEPVLEDAWIRPGVHVSSVGLGVELPQALLDRARVFVESRSAAAPPPAGAQELQGRDPSSLTEIGEVLSGRVVGRASHDDVTVFKSTGHAVEDVAAAALVVRRALRAGVGTTVSL